MEAVFLMMRTDRAKNLKSMFCAEYYGLYAGQPGSGITINRRWVVVY
jgi:hypothetical protein